MDRGESAKKCMLKEGHSCVSKWLTLLAIPLLAIPFEQFSESCMLSVLSAHPLSASMASMRCPVKLDALYAT